MGGWVGSGVVRPGPESALMGPPHLNEGPGKVLLNATGLGDLLVNLPPERIPRHRVELSDRRRVLGRGSCRRGRGGAWRGRGDEVRDDRVDEAHGARTAGVGNFLERQGRVGRGNGDRRSRWRAEVVAQDVAAHRQEMVLERPRKRAV
jgi:hypothetical protein